MRAEFLLIPLLTAIAGIHAYWGFGGLWPASSERDLVDLVVGKMPGDKMPGLVACLAVTAALLVTAVLVAVRAGLLPTPKGGLMHVLPRVGFWGAGSVFLLRGVVGLIPMVTASASDTMFYRWNIWLYSPLCLAIAFLFLWVALDRPLPTPRKRA
jgi:hypothetical protein